jgi:putative Mg2+ transporter-C (MgtC) family protein
LTLIARWLKIAYAIASMGFLGAGAIITGKGSVRGLTTAEGC